MRRLTWKRSPRSTLRSCPTGGTPRGATRLAAPGLFSARPVLDVLDAVLGGHQHRVLGLDDDVVLRPTAATRRSVDTRSSRRVLGDHIARGRRCPPHPSQAPVQRRPRADVAPAGVAAARRLRPSVRSMTASRSSRRAAREGWRRRGGVKSRSAWRRASAASQLRASRREAPEFLHVTTRAEHEHAAVPQVLAGGDVIRGPFGIGLLDEPAIGNVGPLPPPRRI